MVSLRSPLLVYLYLLLSLLPLGAQPSPQVPFTGSKIPRFAQPLPRLNVAGGTVQTVVAGEAEIQLTMCEFKANVLPSGTFTRGVQPETWVWGYYPGTSCPTTTQDTYIGPVIVATRRTPTRIRYTNNLGSAATTNVLAYKYSADQTLHWADPDGLMCNMNEIRGMPPMNPDCAEHYRGAIPAVPHLHGGEVPPVLDGGPNQWFTSDGRQGTSYYTFQDADRPAAVNETIFRYPNSQEAAPLWFHDHTLGATRLNVYAGLAGAYLIQDPNQPLPSNLPGAAEIIPIVLQDRMFDTNGQLYFPAGPGVALNPEHPWWSPEFVGDTIVVNGKAWPYLEVQPKRYRFLFLNGSNARGYELFFTNSVTSVDGPAMWQIATDGGYLDTAVKIGPSAAAGLSKLVLLPGERADVIVDFSGQAVGTKLFLKNIAKTPYPGGATPTGGMDKIMQFWVVAGAAGFVDGSYDPAADPLVRKTTESKIVRLVNPTTGTSLVTPAKRRQLTLNEVMGMGGTFDETVYPGGPSEILVNNTEWSGASRRTYNDFTSIQLGNNPMTALKYSELPQEGTVEQWEIINLTEDAHPIHLHLVQFQLLNRQKFDDRQYEAAYAAAFGGVYEPAFGPPLDYNALNADGAVGGNPAVGPFLKSVPVPPRANEAGWKDTVIMFPGQVTRIMVRYAPTDRPVDAAAMHYPFETDALQRGYVWHCHIIDHEDNEMMRPAYVVPAATAVRSYVLGVDY